MLESFGSKLLLGSKRQLWTLGGESYLKDERMKVGIGFATGRKHFQRVLRSYVYNWKESELVDSKELTLNLFVAYDLNYKNTKKANYTRISSSVN